MDAARWQRIEELFLAVLDREEAERAAFLRGATPDDPTIEEEVAAMLAAHIGSRPLAVESRFLTDPADDPTTTRPATDRDVRAGAYRLVERIGRGGMGEVYRAERADGQYRQTVAVKVIRPGFVTPELLQRFRSERQILARLEHANIARLLDGAVGADGLPYLAMEYVAGTPITEYCDAERLTVEQRLRLFLNVCRAVQYAHGNLVVHRDLKPSNILVTAEGMVKLLDFGIAKLLAPEEPGSPGVVTQTVLPRLTPEYAAPEQVRGEPVTTATDVYALGLLLYELLCGKRAQGVSERTPAAIERSVCDEHPPSPSAALTTDANAEVPAHLEARGGLGLERLRRQLRGDLDTIVATALQKDPVRRYASAEQLAADIERHLTGMPVIARPDTLRYRAGKFLRRHRVGAAATAAISLSMAVGLTLALVGLVRTQRAERRALEEAATASQVSDFLVQLFRVSDPGEAMGNTVTARELLDRGAERIAEDLEGQPAVQARLLETMAGAYGALGLFEPALAIAEQALAVLRANAGDESAEVGSALARIAGLHADLGDYARSRDIARQALVIQERVLPPDSRVLASTLGRLARSHASLGELAEARVALERAFEINERALGPDHRDLGSPLNNLAILHWQQGDLEAAKPLFERALALWERDLGRDHPSVAHVVNNLALVYNQAGDADSARTLHARALAIREKVLDSSHPDIAESLNNLGVVLLDADEFTEARPLFERALDMRERALGRDHTYVATTVANLGFTLLGLGDAETAQPLFERAVAIFSDRVGLEHAMTAAALVGLARIDRGRGDLDAAERRFRRILAIREATIGERHPDYRESLRELATLVRQRGGTTEADSLDARLLQLEAEASPLDP